MKKFIPLLFCLTPFITFSQRYTRQANTDSSGYYEKELKRITKQAKDSLRNSEFFAQYIKYQRRNNNYYAPVISFNILHSDYAAFNKSIAASGFPALNPISYGFGIGFSTKVNFVIIDFYAVSVASQNLSKKGSETIGSSLGNMFQFDLGFNVLRSNRVSLYPYGGLSLRLATLNYKNTGTINPAFTNITDVVNNGQNINATSFRLGYQAGLGLDFTISNNPNGDKTVILFAKGGINQPFGKDTYKIEGQKYDPAIKKGDWMISVGFKFGSRISE